MDIIFAVKAKIYGSLFTYITNNFQKKYNSDFTGVPT